MKTISVETFFSRIVNFREKIGIEMAVEQCHDLFRWLTTSYLNVDQTDPRWHKAVEVFDSTVEEYAARMTIMGRRF